jgi:uncharacterized protein YjbI with pentapeptide repeats
MLNEYVIARGLLDSYRSTRHFSPFILKDDIGDEQVIDDSHIHYFTEHIKEAFHIETSEHWEIVADILDILSEKDMVKVIDTISQEHDGVELSNIERLTRDNKVVNTLIEAGIVEQNGVKILIGSNLDKVIICLETLRTLASLIEKERELNRRRKVTIGTNEFNLVNVDLSWSNLSGMDLSGRNLANADLRGAYLSRANLTRANLINADLRGAYLIESNLTRANLTNADLRGANLSRANLSGVILINAQLREVGLTDVDLTGVNLVNADLRGAYLSRANLTRANLINADLRGAYLIESNLTRANLINANLRETNLFGAYLTGAILINVDFTGANRNRIKQI